MKQIKCELCGSVELIKQDGVYICQHCGTKYSIEEAKKMLIDGVVEVKGKIKVDTSEKLANLYQVARRAKNDNHAENAAKYYDMINIEDPDSWEAAFYVVYFKSIQCKLIEIQTAANSIYNCINTVFGLIKENVSGETEQEEAISEVSNRVIGISDLFFQSAKNHYKGIDNIEVQQDNAQDFINKSFASFRIAYHLGDSLESTFGDKKYAHDLAVKAWNSGINPHSEILNLLSDKEGNKKEILLYEEKIKRFGGSVKYLFAFPELLVALKENMEMQKNAQGKRFIVTDVEIEDIGWGTQLVASNKLNLADGSIAFPSASYPSIAVTIDFLNLSDDDYLKFKQMDIFPLFTEVDYFGDRKQLMYLIDFGEDVVSAAQLFSRIAMQLYGANVSSKCVCETSDYDYNNDANKKTKKAEKKTEKKAEKVEKAEKIIVKKTENTNSSNKLGCLLWGLCFILPLVGLILFFVYKSKGEKSKAKSAIIAAAIGFGLFLLLLMI